MKAHFFDLADRLGRALLPGEVLLLYLSGERSDFVRFNRDKVRQAGSVEQRYLTVRLVREGRQAAATLAIAGNGGDQALARATIARLRDDLAQLRRIRGC